MTYAASPMVALMRECIATPCRGSGLPSDALIDVVRQEFDSPIRRTGLRSSKKGKAVTFEDVSLSPSNKTSKRRRSRARSASPRKALSQKDENARPSTSDGPEATKSNRSARAAGTTADREIITRQTVVDRDSSRREVALAELVDSLRDDLEERDLKIQKLTDLVQFLSTEVKVYTKSLEQQLASQQEELEALRRAVSD